MKKKRRLLHALSNVFTSPGGFLKVLEEVISDLVSTQLLDPCYFSSFFFLRQVLQLCPLLVSNAPLLLLELVIAQRQVSVDVQLLSLPKNLLFQLGPALLLIIQTLLSELSHVLLAILVAPALVLHGNTSRRYLHHELGATKVCMVLQGLAIVPTLLLRSFVGIQLCLAHLVMFQIDPFLASGGVEVALNLAQVITNLQLSKLVFKILQLFSLTLCSSLIDLLL
eukprot:XP_001707830.1 Hypothetical protein GL50803_20327 [Giardia lamblia ATCC 50803]